jgi:hypothetical protein
MTVKQCVNLGRATGKDYERARSTSLAALGRSMSACFSSGYISSDCVAALRLHFPAAQVVRYIASTVLPLS